jgi:hypothetical protein
MPPLSICCCCCLVFYPFGQFRAVAERGRPALQPHREDLPRWNDGSGCFSLKNDSTMVHLYYILCFSSFAIDNCILTYCYSLIIYLQTQNQPFEPLRTVTVLLRSLFCVLVCCGGAAEEEIYTNCMMTMAFQWPGSTVWAFVLVGCYCPLQDHG